MISGTLPLGGESLMACASPVFHILSRLSKSQIRIRNLPHNECIFMIHRFYDLSFIAKHKRKPAGMQDKKS